jgi:hypothetical protein
VKGWDGGLDWINTSTLLSRYSFGNALVVNRGKRGTMVDPKLLLDQTDAKTPAQLVDYFLKLLGLYDVDKDTKSSLQEYLQKNDNGSSGSFNLNDQTIDKKVRGLIHLILSLPDYQLN